MVEVVAVRWWRSLQFALWTVVAFSSPRNSLFTSGSTWLIACIKATSSLQHKRSIGPHESQFRSDFQRLREPLHSHIFQCVIRVALWRFLQCEAVITRFLSGRAASGRFCGVFRLFVSCVHSSNCPVVKHLTNHVSFLVKVLRGEKDSSGLSAENHEKAPAYILQYSLFRLKNRITCLLGSRNARTPKTTDSR